MPYAEYTKVPVSQSKGDIEKLTVRRGATQFVAGHTEDSAMVGFRTKERMLRFRIPVDPKANDRQRRQLWRALLLVIKAKFEAVDMGIETFDEAFLPNIVMHDGTTYGDWSVPQIKLMYQTGEMPKLLPGPK